MKTFVAVDFHKSYSYGSIMNQAGEILKQGRFANHPEALGKFLGEFAGPDCSAVLEATRGWSVMHDWLEDVAGQVTLAHPLKVKAIAEARIKTDKVDAQTLAHLLRCDLIPAAHVCSPQARLLRRVLRHRMFLVSVRTMAKNRIHDLLDRYPLIRAQWQAEELFSKLGITWMRQIELPAPERLILDSELQMLEHLNLLVKEAEAYLQEVGSRDVRVRNLMTIPGIGKTLAMLVVAEIDDVRRFARVESLHAYAGLVPSTYSSGGHTQHGAIIKTSNKYLRWAMIEAVWPAIRTDVGLSQFYHRLAARKPTNTARVATARRLLTIVYRVLTENREYRP
mgnify:CR=1 FL=1